MPGLYGVSQGELLPNDQKERRHSEHRSLVKADLTFQIYTPLFWVISKDLILLLYTKRPQTKVTSIPITKPEQIANLAQNIQKLAQNIQKLAQNIQKLAQNIQKLAQNIQKLAQNIQKLKQNIQKRE